VDSTYLILAGVFVIGAFAYFFFQKEKPANTASAGLQLQAYERLALLVDRITLSSLISRTSHDGLSAREMQLVLTRSIRDEFDYNITQQIYVTHETWNAVKNLKEKNLLIINQVGSILPASASGLDLNKAILEYLLNDPKANQHELVGQALSYEAKKLL
jgi:reverse gyrase